MDAPFGEQVISLIGTLAALVVAGFTVAGVLVFGLETGAGLFGIFMVSLVSSRYVIGRSIRPRPEPEAEPPGDDSSS